MFSRMNNHIIWIYVVNKINNEPFTLVLFVSQSNNHKFCIRNHVTQSILHFPPPPPLPCHRLTIHFILTVSRITKYGSNDVIFMNSNYNGHHLTQTIFMNFELNVYQTFFQFTLNISNERNILKTLSQVQLSVINIVGTNMVIRIHSKCSVLFHQDCVYPNQPVKKIYQELSTDLNIFMFYIKMCASPASSQFISTNLFNILLSKTHPR